MRKNKIAVTLCLMVSMLMGFSSAEASDNPKIDKANKKEPITTPFTDYSIFTGSETPVNGKENDGQGIELGMKFQVTTAGTVSAIRYYKTTGTTGTHLGNIWSTSGTLLGQATFTSETASGWQQVTFSSPVNVAANTTYIASYFSPSGDYCGTAPFFTSAVTNGPLKALANNEDGANGLYRYTSTSAVPNAAGNAAKYWVDVVFTPGGSDTQVPSVPSGLSYTALTQTTFTLNWAASTDNVGVTGYEVFKGGVSIGTPAANSFAVTGLTAATTYSFTVRARDAVPNWSAQSSALPVTTSAAGGGGTVSGTANYVAKFTSNTAVGNSQIFDNGVSVGIGTTVPGASYKLVVEGTIGARKLKITQATWADYVFEKNYRLLNLKEVERFIQQHKHLPDVPSATEIGKNGLDVGDGQALLLQKIEELTLYVIELQKENERQDTALQELKNKFRKK